jgi:hypothetical protein
MFNNRYFAGRYFESDYFIDEPTAVGGTTSARNTQEVAIAIEGGVNVRETQTVGLAIEGGVVVRKTQAAALSVHGGINVRKTQISVIAIEGLDTSAAALITQLRLIAIQRVVYDELEYDEEIHCTGFPTYADESCPNNTSYTEEAMPSPFSGSNESSC